MTSCPTESRLRNPDPRPEKRVGGFSAVSCSCTSVTWSNADEPHQETAFTATTSASGICSWLSKDPIGIAGGLNQYVAFDNNPVMYIDPLGLVGDDIDGNKVVIHKTDVDDWPSDPHGHIYEKKVKVDTEGRFIRGTRSNHQVVGKFSRRGIVKWKQLLEKARLERLRCGGPLFQLLLVVPEILPEVDRFKRSRENGRTYLQELQHDLESQPFISNPFTGEPVVNPLFIPPNRPNET